jgi:hypothetical protein
MKLFYTLIQPFGSDENRLDKYFISMGIKYRMGADIPGDILMPMDRLVKSKDNPLLYYKYLVLLDESDLTAISLRFSNFQLAENRPWPNFLNKIRKVLAWLGL